MCDRTRIITIGVHKALGPGPDPANTTLVGHYHSEDASGGTWHGLAHDWGNENSRRMLKGINAWIAARCSRKLIAKLDVAEGRHAPTSTTRSSTGATSSASTTSATACRACWRAARAASSSPAATSTTSTGTASAYFAQENGNVIKGIPHNQFLVTAMQAMGLAPADYETGGKPGYGSTSTSGREPDLWAADYDLATVGQILPGIRP